MFRSRQLPLLGILLVLIHGGISQFMLSSLLNRIAPAFFRPPTLKRSLSTSNANYKYRQSEILDGLSGETLEWEVDWDSNSVIFNISLQTSGNVFFGLAPVASQVKGADVIVGGVRTDGQSFIVDMHGLPNNRIAEDSSQDWKIISAQRSEGRTNISISRILDTCDNQDLLINDDLVHILWGYTDQAGSDIPSEFIPRGSIRAYLLDPVTTPTENNLKTWRVSRRLQIPRRHTSYWCTIHRAPSLRNKHHIVGFSPYFANDVARNRIHHQIVYRCYAPPGINADVIFERLINHPGEECYLQETHELPIMFCSEMIHISAVGGKPFHLPNNVGIPLGGVTEYFMLETHYNLQDEEINDDSIVEHGVDFQYTSHLRPEEGNVIIVGYGVLGMFMVPPQSPNFNVIGNCPSECTRQLVPPSGMEIVATMLHAHMTSKTVRMTQRRGNTELPWIMSDNNYDFNYQQFRLLRKPVSLRRGDHLATECTFNTLARNKTTVSGYSTRSEMCITFVMVNKIIPILYCASERSTEKYMTRYSIQNMSWDVTLSERVVNSANNPNLVGLTFSQAADMKESWTPNRRKEVEMEQNYGVHIATCPNVRQVAMMGYLAYFVEGMTLGFITLAKEFNKLVPTTTHLSSPQQPGHYFPVSLAPRTSIYSPPRTCPVY